MSTLIKSTLILAFARVTNFALVFFSPILLVRILDPTSFGQYREFVAYSMMITSIAAFSISSNLLYFVPRHPDNARRYVSHTNWLTFGMSLLACLLIWAFGDQIRAKTSFDFLLPLSVYVLLFVNVTFLDAWWIATKQPKYVFYYSTARTVARLAAVVVTAWITRSIEAILVALIIVESLRVAIVLLVSRLVGLLSFGVDRNLMRQQLRFIVPLGLGTSLYQVHQYIGQIVISAELGVVALAVYAIASYKVPVVRIVRSAVSDAIFPDMVRQAASNQSDRLRLWKRGNVAYSFLILPVFVVLFWYADVLIPFMFTDKYADAVPIFRILTLILPLETIELNSPLRAANRTPAMLLGNVVLLASNLLCILIVFRYFREIAIFGPAIGMVAGFTVQLVYLGWRVLRLYDIGIKDLLKWRSQVVIWLCTFAGGLLLVAGEFVPMPELYRMVVFTLLYGIVYVAMIRYFKLEEVETLMNVVRRKLTRGKPDSFRN